MTQLPVACIQSTPSKINKATYKLRSGIFPRTSFVPDFVSILMKNNGDKSKPANIVTCQVPATSQAGEKTAAKLNKE